MSVNFYLDKRTDKCGDAPVRVSIAIMGTRFLTSTGLKVPPAKWDAARQQARKGTANAAGMTWAVINSALARIAEFFTRYENECVLENVVPDAGALKAMFAREFGRRKAPAEEAPGFADRFAEFIRERGEVNQWSRRMTQKFEALWSHLRRWRPGVSFDDFTEAGLTSFVGFLRDGEGLMNSTTAKQLNLLKWFLRWATMRGYNTDTSFQTFNPRFKTAPPQVVFLDWEELMRVFDYEVPREGTEVCLHTADGREYRKTVRAARGLRVSRDIFCFCCFTSLRYSDAVNLKRADISGGAITITTVKTADKITIELNKYARAVLERYAGEDLGGYALPSISNQRMNVYLKELCELCGINHPVTRTYYRGAERIDETLPKYELIGTHTGRRTFICNALSMGIPAEIVMKWTGHADFKSMRPYVDIVNGAKAAAMARFDER